MRNAIAPHPSLSRACDARNLFEWNWGVPRSTNGCTCLYMPILRFATLSRGGDLSDGRIKEVACVS